MRIKNSIFLLIILLLETYGNFEETKPPGLFPDDYNKYEPPWERGKPADVYIQLDVMDVDKIDDGKMEFRIQSYLYEYWKDARLNLSSFTEKDDIEPVFPAYLNQDIWIPYLVFDNARDGKLFHLSLPNSVLNVLKDGSFKRVRRYNLNIGCRMDFHFYPMDTQKCHFKISLMANTDSKVLLYWGEDHPNGDVPSITLVYNIQPLKYVLHEPQSYRNTEILLEENYTYLYANFTFERRLTGNIFNVYVPSILVVLLSWISMWLDVEAVPARVTLGVTSLLTLVTQIVQAHAGLPSINYMTAMDIWLFVCLITVFSSLLEFAFAYRIFVLNKQRTVKDECKKENESNVKLILRRRLRQDLSFEFQNEKNTTFSVKPKQMKKIEISLDKICRKLFPLLFIIFCVIYWSYFLSLK